MAECLFLSPLYLSCDSPSPAIDAVKEVWAHSQNGPTAEILTVFLVGLSTKCLTLPALGPRTLLPNGACYIDQLGERHVCLCLLLTSPFLSLLLFLLSSSPLSVAAAERLYSQLERNRLLSNELKLTLHGLCD